MAKENEQEVKTFPHYSLGEKQVSEKELVERAKKNPEAFGILYDTYLTRIYAFILKRVSNVQTAEDITSLTFEKALKKLATFKWQDVSFSAWLYRIAVNNVTDYYRQKGRRQQTDIDSVPEIKDEQESPDVKISRSIFFEKVQSILPSLDDIDQTVLTLKLFAEKSNEEISETVGIKRDHVAVKIHRALKKLRSKLHEEGIEY
ncbi:RNA polymerase sigma factor [Patescibacteria group bacterium]